MSTEYDNKAIRDATASSRFAQLGKLGETIFHAKDLATLWGIENLNTLYVTLKRYAEQGLLYRIQKGLYSLKPIEDINPKLLGIKALHQYAYVSCETVLAEHGIIQQAIPWVTLVSSESKKFHLGSHQYYSRRLADKFLYNAFDIEDVAGVLQANRERAVADLLYFNRHAFFDGAKLLDWVEVQRIQKEIGYPVTQPQSI